ncbi:unnamed protein product [Phytophthora fragariaefolia]|uniref:Unnamed protein product n=1 Tax=Phytophthora fragariaefolia TaxID=1490495 RepID=A0A9W7CVL5_9STRA|nr:unnamed protein product [Phytophthora fragariaefolia]
MESQFELEPVSVERIDILESKLRDHEKKLDKLQADRLSTCNAAIVQLAAESRVNGRLWWHKFVPDDFNVNSEDDIVTVLQPVIYSIGAIVASTPEINCNTELMKNGMSLQIAYAGGLKDCPCLTPLNAVTRLQKDDELVIICSHKPSSTSYLSVVRLSG